ARRRVALTARAPDSKSGGWGFESLHACQIARIVRYGISDAVAGVLPGRDARHGGGRRAEPARGGGVDGGGAGGGLRAVHVPGRGRRGVVAPGGGDPEMSETGATPKQWFLA